MILFERDLFMLNDLFLEMINYFAGDAKRIQHLVKVHSFAKLIGELEHVEEKPCEYWKRRHMCMILG